MAVDLARPLFENFFEFNFLTQFVACPVDVTTPADSPPSRASRIMVRSTQSPLRVADGHEAARADVPRFFE